MGEKQFKNKSKKESSMKVQNYDNTSVALKNTRGAFSKNFTKKDRKLEKVNIWHLQGGPYRLYNSLCSDR